MARNPVPGLSLPSPYDPSRQPTTNQQILQWSKGVSPRMLVVDVSLDGGSPPTPPSDAFLMICGCQSVVFSSGVGTITFPKPFPNGVVVVLPIWNAAVTGGGGNFTLGVTAGTATTATLSAEGPSGAYGSTVNIMYIAVGY